MAQWHCHIGGKSYGPIDAQQVRQWVQDQRMQPTDSVWCEGMAAWQPANTVQDLLAPASPAGAVPPPLGQATSGGEPPPPAQYLPPHRGTTILVLGILGLTVCGVLGIFAWVMGSADLREMAAGRMDPAGRSNTNAGKVCGMIATILILVGVALSIIFGIATALSFA